MKCKEEEPILLHQRPISLVPEPGNLGESLCNHSIFIAGWLVVLPLGGPPETKLAVLVEYHVDCEQSMVEWEGAEISQRWESPNILLESVSKATQCWICDYEVGKCVEATQGSGWCKLLHPLGDHCFAIRGIDTTKEDIEAIYHNSGVNVG